MRRSKLHFLRAYLKTGPKKHRYTQQLAAVVTTAGTPERRKYGGDKPYMIMGIICLSDWNRAQNWWGPIRVALGGVLEFAS